MKTSISLEQVQELLHYCEKTGVFFWKVKRQPSINIGDQAGFVGGDGYVRIKINGERYLGHRLAWLCVYGQFPSADIDHINGNRQDNHISNLRQATRTENARNKATRRDNTSGATGVSFDKRRNTWRAQCSIDGRRQRIGEYAIKQDAIDAYENFTAAAWGEFKPSIVRKINERMAVVSITADGLASLGFPRIEDGASLDRDFPAICAAIVRHVQSVAMGVAA